MVIAFVWVCVCVFVDVCGGVRKLKRLRVGHVDVFNRRSLFLQSDCRNGAYGNLCSILLRINHFCTGSCGRVNTRCELPRTPQARVCVSVSASYSYAACVCVYALALIND